eukprot:1144123-Pelagomonas_calceolata.AAC.1
MDGGRQSVERLVQLLVSEQESTPETLDAVLGELLQVLNTSLDGRMCFSSMGGYAAVLDFLRSHPDQVSEVLLAAGSEQEVEGGCLEGSQKKAAGAIQISWPHLVIFQLVSAAIDWGDNPSVAERECACLLQMQD